MVRILVLHVCCTYWELIAVKILLISSYLCIYCLLCTCWCRCYSVFMGVRGQFLGTSSPLLSHGFKRLNSDHQDLEIGSEPIFNVWDTYIWVPVYFSWLMSKNHRGNIKLQAKQKTWSVKAQENLKLLWAGCVLLSQPFIWLWYLSSHWLMLEVLDLLSLLLIDTATFSSHIYISLICFL